jgi:hypothetical protein
MAKITGLGQTTLNLDNDAAAAQDIRNDVTNYDFGTPYNVQEITGVDKSAVERQLLLADYSGTLNGVVNPSANRQHAVMSGDLRVVRTLAMTVAAQTLSAEVLLTDYKWTRASGGELTYQTPFSLADGTTPDWT